MNIGIRLAEFLDSVGFELVILFIRDGYEVKTLFFELTLEVTTMIHTSTKHHSLFRTTKKLVGIFNPLADDIPRDLHTTLGYLFFLPLAECVFVGACHVDLFGNKDLERCEPATLNQVTRGLCSHYIRVSCSKPLGERGGSQSDYLEARILLDIVNHAFALDMALIDDHEVDVRKGIALLKGLCRANLNALHGSIPPMV